MEFLFILDVHLGKLARLLRMAGFDTLYRNNMDDPEIISIAQHQDRIVLTRDRGILANKKVKRGHFVQSIHPHEQLKEIIDAFDLSNHLNLLSRCMACNGVIDKVNKQEVEEQLMPGTRKNFEEFFRCSQCRKVYWKGSHYEKMLLVVQSLNK